MTWRDKLEAARAGFDQAMDDPVAAQAALLQDIVRSNADTEFGREHGFAEVTDLASYRRRVPVAAFADLAPSIDRMLEGEDQVLIGSPPIFFARTSGTSGVPKNLPFPANVDQEYWGFLGPLLAALERDYPGALEAGLTLSGKYIEGQTPRGVPFGSASGFTRNVFRGMPFWYVAPEPVFEEPALDLRYYLLLYYAIPRPLRALTSLNPSTLLTLFKKAEELGPALADDLERGTLEAGPPGLAEMVSRLGPLPGPAPEAAARLRDSLKSEGRFVPHAVWPDLAVVQVWKGGSSSLYLPTLSERLPGCTLRPLPSSSTEGAFFVPLADSWTGGVPALLSSVIEFLPAEREPDPDNFVDLGDLEIGRGYRIAITNRRGMYRYLVDDVFYMDDRHRGLPLMRYSHRHNLTSSLTGEKLTELDVTTAMTHALAATGLEVAEFQLGPRWGDPPRYVLVVELSRPCEDEPLRALLHAFEHALADANLEYHSKRESARLSQPELVLVRPGEFERLKRQRSADLGRSDAQVKIPRLRTKLIEPGTFDAAARISW